jgi:hypothetical protein
MLGGFEGGGRLAVLVVEMERVGGSCERQLALMFVCFGGSFGISVLW